MPVAGEQPDAGAVAPRHQPEVVMLDLVYLVGAGGWALGGRWKAGFDETGWTGTHQHTGVIAATGVNGESYKKGSPLSPRSCWRRNGNPAGLAERRGSAAPLIQRESCGGAAVATRASGRVFRAKKKSGSCLWRAEVLKR
jgi:hypothetical protein